MEIGLGIDSRFALNDADQRALAAEAAALGYDSLWTPVRPNRDESSLCVSWHEASGLATGISVLPIDRWSVDELARSAREADERTGGRFTLGVGSGRIQTGAVARAREIASALRSQIPGVRLFLGALGPRMLRLAGAAYDGAALNWCSPEQVAWSRKRVAQGAGSARRDPGEIRIHEYVRVCVDDDEARARDAFARMVLSYAMAGPGANKRLGYRAHFARMGFAEVLERAEARRDAGASPEELAPMVPDELLRRVGYWGRPDGARTAFERLAAGLDTAVVRPVPARRNDAAALREAMRACAPRRSGAP